MHVRFQHPLHLSIEQDRPVHLRKLEEALGGERHVDHEAPVADRVEDRGLADDDKRAGPCRDDHVEPLAQLGPGSHLAELRTQRRLEPSLIRHSSPLPSLERH